MNQSDAPTQKARLSFGEAPRRWLAASEARNGWAADRALWICLAVAGLSLFSAYVLVLRDVVRNGEVVRTAFSKSQQQVPPARAGRAALASDGGWLAAAPTNR